MKQLMLGLGLATMVAQAGMVKLTELELAGMSSGWDRPNKNESIVHTPLTVAGKVYANGVGGHSPSRFDVVLDGKGVKFEAMVGVDDVHAKRGTGELRFQVYADRKLVADSGVMKTGMAAKKLVADLKGAKVVSLRVDPCGVNSFDHADWCEAVFEMVGEAKPVPFDPAKTPQLGIISPKAGAAPRFTGPKIFGVRPGNPILFKVTAAGEKPMQFTAEGLPEGVSFDPSAGMLGGACAKAGRYQVKLTAKNAKGEARRDFVLAVGKDICLTPPMGWNSWYVYYSGVRASDMRDAADGMVSSGLIDHGWSYVNVDDFWETKPGEKKDQTLMGPERQPDGTIGVNSRFPDMKALADYIHAKGLKAGLYTSPGPLTCGGCTASWRYEEKDAKTFADWGYDFVKYDWCSYGAVAVGKYHQHAMAPYMLMGKALERQNRDMVFSLCQYGMDFVSAWGKQAGGHLWRTTNDSGNRWEWVQHILDQQAGLEFFSGPGAWNDPDMLFVGKVGDGFGAHRRLVPTKLTQNEQYTQMSMWCLLAAPLLISCDMVHLDEFTVSILTNDELIDINQDVLGKGAGRIYSQDGIEVWARPLEDGSIAMGFFNSEGMPTTVEIPLAKLGLKGNWKVRDCWRQCDRGEVAGSVKVNLLGHATDVLKFSAGSGAGLLNGMEDIREQAWRSLFKHLQ